MSTIPRLVKDHISNARYYLGAADKFPSPSRDAVCILLLFIAWENMQIAKDELSGWASKTVPSKKLYKSHAHKFQKASPITRVILGQRGALTRTKTYSSGADFEELFSLCRYGSKTGQKALISIFDRGWHLDSFRNSLIGNIKWVEMMIDILESLPNHSRKH